MQVAMDNAGDTQASLEASLRSEMAIFASGLASNLTLDFITTHNPNPVANCKVTALPNQKPSETIKYTVKKGDTLWGISKKYSVAVDDLKNDNNLKDDTIKIGQVLTINVVAPKAFNVHINLDYQQRLGEIVHPGQLNKLINTAKHNQMAKPYTAQSGGVWTKWGNTGYNILTDNTGRLISSVGSKVPKYNQMRGANHQLIIHPHEQWESYEAVNHAAHISKFPSEGLEKIVHYSMKETAQTVEIVGTEAEVAKIIGNIGKFAKFTGYAGETVVVFANGYNVWSKIGRAHV